MSKCSSSTRRWSCSSRHELLALSSFSFGLEDAVSKQANQDSKEQQTQGNQVQRRVVCWLGFRVLSRRDERHYDVGETNQKEDGNNDHHGEVVEPAAKGGEASIVLRASSGGRRWGTVCRGSLGGGGALAEGSTQTICKCRDCL